MFDFKEKKSMKEELKRNGSKYRKMKTGLFKIHVISTKSVSPGKLYFIKYHNNIGCFD